MSRNTHNGENGDSGKTSSEVLLGKVDKLTKMANLEKNKKSDEIAMGLANI